MRSLTDAEARVLSLLLANTAPDERGRLKESGLPRSTYHAARRRAYAEGWLRDRYLPAPTRFGFPSITIALARPFADQVPTLSEEWANLPGCVLLWVGTQSALGVFFHRSPTEQDRVADRVGAVDRASACLLLHPAVELGGLPVYFDFEGSWAHLAGDTGSRGYPKGLPPTLAPEARGPARWTGRERWAARELLRRPFEAEARGRPGHLIGPFGLPGAQKRLLAEGWVLYRVLAAPERIPPFRGRQADRIALISGTLREGITAPALFGALTQECRVYPFLYAVDGKKLLLGALGQSPGPSAPASPSRRPVLATLRQALEGIEIVEEHAGHMRAPVDHRYDRLAPPEG